MIEFSETAQVTAFLTVAAGVITALSRFWSSMKMANKDEENRYKHSSQIMNDLQEEIKRLKKDIEDLTAYIRAMDKNYQDIRDLEVDAATDFGALQIITAQFPCITCTNNGEAFAQLSDVISRMTRRREKRRLLMNMEGASRV